MVVFGGNFHNIVYSSLAFIYGLVFSFILLVVGSYTDFKWRELPDWISYGSMYLGIFMSLIYSVILKDVTFVLNSIYGIIFAYIIGALMYYTGLWGGGDSKALMGMGALLGFSFQAFNYTIFEINQYNFLVVFFINSLIIGAFYGLFWSFVLAIIKFRKFWKEFKNQFKRYHIFNIIVFSMIIVSIVVFSLSSSFALQFMMLMMALLFFVYWLIVLVVKAVEKCCMFKLVEPEKLVEGDWIATEIIIKENVVPYEFLKKRVAPVLERDKERSIKIIILKFINEIFNLKFLDNYIKKIEYRFSFEYEYKRLVDNIALNLLLYEYKGIKRVVSFFVFVFNTRLIKKVAKTVDLFLRNDKKFYSKNSRKYEYIKNLDKVLEQYNIYFDKIYVSGPKELGIEREHIQMLIDMRKSGKIDKVLVKEGVPFIPSFFIAFLYTLLYGNIFALLL